MELDAAVGGEGEQIGFVQELERRMRLEEVCYAVWDGGGLHEEPEERCLDSSIGAAGDTSAEGDFGSQMDTDGRG
jgi:hypothetical protein